MNEPLTAPPWSAREYFAAMGSAEITRAAKETGLTRWLLADHVSKGTRLSFASAKRLERWDARISADKTCEAEPEAPGERCANCTRERSRGAIIRDESGKVTEWCCERMALKDVADALREGR